MSAFNIVTVLDSTDPSTTETPQDLLNDRIYLIGSTTISGLAYGIVLCLYVSCAYFIVQNLRLADKTTPRQPCPGSRPALDRRRWFFHLAYTSVLNILAVIYTAGTSQTVVSAYVDDGVFPGGQLPYFLEVLWRQPEMIMLAVTYLLILWLTDALILWRFIILSQALRKPKWIILLPCAMYVGVVVLSCVVNWQEAVLAHPVYGPSFLAYCALSFSLNILTTLLICAYIYMYTRNLVRILGKSSTTVYTNILTMLVESAALNGVWSLVFVVLYFCKSAGVFIVLTSMTYVQIIAQLLIILSIARGTAWDSKKQEVLSNIRFERRAHGSAVDETRSDIEIA